MASSCEVVIVGAGPYGLSLAAHLASRNVPFRIFGRPMHSWQTQMPEGMLLKSEGFASSLYAPGDAYPLRAYCAERGIPYQDVGLPVSLETFIAYGQEFQRRFVPNLEQREVTRIERRDGGYLVRLADDETVLADNVVIAVGVRAFAHIAPELSGLPPEMVTHSSDHSALGGFAGKQVAVVGGGASAVDLAASLKRAGAHPHLIARRTKLAFHEPPRVRSLWERIRDPRSGLGFGWKSLLCEELPLVFHKMPQEFRHRVVREHLGPAPGWFVRAQVEGKMPITLGATIRHAVADSGKAVITLATNSGEKIVAADHVIAATGYRVDLRSLSFLAPSVLSAMRLEGHSPVLSSRFETSLPGLFFTGPAAANSFGPLMRFGCGCKFAAKRMAPFITQRVAQQKRRATVAPAPVEATPGKRAAFSS